MSEPRERAAHLLRWYPRAWRARYGEEFTELLLADLAERSRSAARTADVIRGGLVARLADAGLCGCAPQVPELARAQARAGLASLACCAAVFLGVGGAIWGQLVIGWQWSAPATAGTVVATFVMTGTVLVLAGLVIMIVGGRHFGNGWPGTGGHPWARTGLVPGGLAAFCWACTLSVSSFWAHPAALAAFPAAELTWMTLSPIALACLVAGAATTVRRAELSPALLRFEGRLGVAACVTMAVFLGGGCAWLAGRTAPPGSPFRPGAIDVAGLAVMALALAVARRALRQARAGAR